MSDLLLHLKTRYLELVDDPRLRRAHVKFGETSDNRPKHSAWIFFRGERDGALIVWVSGEAEFECGSDPSSTVREHHEIETADEIDVLLERLVKSVT